MLPLKSILAVALTFPAATAVGTNDQVNANIDHGTFQNPASNVRPRFRYWVRDASVSTTQVAADIKAAAAIGMGGMDLLGYYF